ncbi:MAG: hypothetical protein A3F54_02290 [Candidatus Kerfeldbacteria bacterium RIFCSPHIGHO2_12_FULL_48_17]|uniref:Uncharacterized protein n=1 Tax=Candidatus Kerfeldbacteria bacterium RIFCSPHIGHO2_12_FULL_48_17 TaxID=1798542 RepID=A0A1G2B289_9BACT|nr:MAG: hypothetical protein A3F54_02290 [Candidatus Kerfeldbacteria bacterium RIFCSPHIGHO2_12_FULL_48_17]
MFDTVGLTQFLSGKGGRKIKVLVAYQTDNARPLTCTEAAVAFLTAIAVDQGRRTFFFDASLESFGLAHRQPQLPGGQRAVDVTADQSFDNVIPFDVVIRHMKKYVTHMDDELLNELITLPQGV